MRRVRSKDWYGGYLVNSIVDNNCSGKRPSVLIIVRPPSTKIIILLDGGYLNEYCTRIMYIHTKTSSCLLFAPANIKRILDQEVIPLKSDRHGGQMPKGMSIDDSSPRGEIKELQCCGPSCEEHEYSRLAHELWSIGFRLGGESSQERY